jgi:hypothetical protein
LSAKKIEQNRHPLSGWNESDDHCLQTTDSCADKPNCVAWPQGLLDYVHFEVTHKCAQFLNHSIRDGRPAIPEVNNAADPSRVLDPPQLERQIKARKKVTLE